MAVKNCFIRGSVVRYVQLPSEHVDTQLLEDATRRGEDSLISSNDHRHSRRLSWIYRLYLAIDANFRLKRRLVSSEEADPSLSDGWAYFVKQESYKAHLRAHDKAPQPVSASS